MRYTCAMNEMLKKSEQPPVKVFPFRFSALMIVVFTLLLCLCAAGIGITTWPFVGCLKGDISSIYEWLKYLLLYVVSGLLGVLIAAMLISSRYLITDKELIVRFGLIRQRFELKKIRSVHLFKGSNKLTVYFDDFKTKYTVIVVKEIWYDEFIRTMMLKNENIGFDFTSAEEESQNRKKK